MVILCLVLIANMSANVCPFLRLKGGSQQYSGVTEVSRSKF